LSGTTTLSSCFSCFPRRFALFAEFSHFGLFAIVKHAVMIGVEFLQHLLSEGRTPSPLTGAPTGSLSSPPAETTAALLTLGPIATGRLIATIC
jgi:hypothetical protein